MVGRDGASSQLLVDSPNDWDDQGLAKSEAGSQESRVGHADGGTQLLESVPSSQEVHELEAEMGCPCLKQRRHCWPEGSMLLHVFVTSMRLKKKVPQIYLV